MFRHLEWPQKKDHFPKTDSCNENALFLFTFRTQIVFAYFSKKWQFYKKPFFFTTTQKTPFFPAFFEIFLFHFFIFSLLLFSNMKKTKTKSAHFFFGNPFLDTLTNCQKIFEHPYTLFEILNTPKNTYKTWEKQAKIILDQVLTQPWTKFWLKKPQILDQVLTLQHIIMPYMYICCKVKNWSNFCPF